MKHTPYTEYEEQILLHRANQYLGGTGQVQWRKVPPIPNRDKKSMSNHWQVLKKRCRYDGKQWVLKEKTLFDKVTPQPKRDNAKKTPQNKRERISTKRVVVKKSFLWGAFILERYE